MFRDSVKGTGYPLHSPVSPSLPLQCVTVCHHISTGLHPQMGHQQAQDCHLAVSTCTVQNSDSVITVSDPWRHGKTRWAISTHIASSSCPILIPFAANNSQTFPILRWFTLFFFIWKDWKFHCCKHRATTLFLRDMMFNPLAPELFFLILAHSVYKMWIIQEPNKLALWNKLHFEEKKAESIEHV